VKVHRSICKEVSVRKIYFPWGFIQLVLAQGTIDILIVVGNILGITHGEGK
jgi:hypothetical protein